MRNIQNEQEICRQAAKLVPQESHWNKTFFFNAFNPDPHPFVVAQAKKLLEGVLG